MNTPWNGLSDMGELMDEIMKDALRLTGCGEPPPIKTLTCDAEKLRRRVDEVHEEIVWQTRMIHPLWYWEVT